MITTHYGSVITWFPQRNFGFIKFDVPVAGLPEEIFVHKSDAPPQTLVKDARVSFEIGKFGGRLKAFNVKGDAGYTAIDPVSGGAK